ncbi:MAG: DUF2341 domain-containing protein [Nitrospirae bacterium]|nr:DUF2341 domain-containing protein [Nitrospirota bacterium]
MKISNFKFQILNFILALLSLFAFAPGAYSAGGDVIWQYGATPAAGKQEAEATVVDTSGNTIITGYTDQSGNDDYFTVKIAPDGSGVLWSRTYDKAGGDDHATAVALDSDDNVIVTGYVWNGTSYDFHTIKYRGSDGTVLWQHTFNAAINGNDYATSVAIDGVNSIYVAGNSQGANGADDIMLIKYGPGGPNPDGTPICQRSFNGAANGHDRIISITSGIDGIAVTGESENSAHDFDGLTIKYNFDCTPVWQKQHAVSGNEKGRAVDMDASGNVIVTGTDYNGSSKDIYTVKYGAPAGDILWSMTYDGGYNDEPAAVFVDSFGDVFITGFTYTLTGADNIYTAKYDGGTGVLRWGRIFNSLNGNNDRAVSLAVDESGDIFIGGDTYDDAGADYNFVTLKYTKDNGTLLWQKSYDGPAGRDDRAIGIRLTSSGQPVIAGWTDVWTAGASDYDYYAIKYDPGLLNPPTGLTAATISNSQIDLSWTDNSTNEDGFRIERKIGEPGVYAQIAETGAGASVYNDTGLDPDTKYYYRVRSYNSTEGDSHYSNETYSVTTVYTYTPPVWSHIYNGAGSGDDYVTDISNGPDNHPVATGYSFSSTGQLDYYTLKLNREDNSVLWGARYDSDQNDLDIAETIMVDGGNAVLVSGYSYLYSAQSSGNTNDIYSIRYPSTGPPEDWHDQYNGPAGDDDRSSVVDVSKDGADNYVVVGYGRNADWNDDIYVVKYLNDGSRAWAAAPYDGGVMGHDYPSAVAFDASGDIFVAGYTYNGADYDYFTAKYNGGTGAVIWSDVYGGAGSGNDYSRAIAVDNSGNAYVTGLAVTASGNEDFLTIKYDGATGARTWVRTKDGTANGFDEAAGVAADTINNAVVVSGTVLTSAGNKDLHIIRYDPDGNVLWERTVDRPGSNDVAVATAMDLSGNVHIAGDTDNGSNSDIISVQYGAEGTFLGGSVYNGVANANDGAAAITVNSIGEAFAGGYTVNASGNADYVVFKITNNMLQPSAPLTTAPSYDEVVLSWSDNSLSEDGFHIERKTGLCSSSEPWSLIYAASANETSFTDTLLGIGAEYCYRVRAFKNNGETSLWTEQGSATFAPPAPSGLTASAADTTQIDLSWSDNTTGEDGFKIERCAGAGCSDFAEIAVAGANTTSYQDASVCGSTSYSYRVEAYRTGRWSTGYGSQAQAATSTPGAPGTFTATRISEAQINLSWTDTIPDETGFKVDRCTGAGCADFAEIASLAANTTTYSDSGLAPATSFTYRVRAYKTAACPWETTGGAASATTSVSAPSGLSDSTANTTQINLSWTDRTVSETGFKIERCGGAGCSDFTEIDTVAANAVTYQDTTVCSSTSYNYRVRAYKTGEWDSGYSNTTSATTGAPSAPSGLAASGATEVRITLTWTGPTTDETGFRIERCAGPGCGDFTEVTTVAANTTTYNDTGLMPSTTYNYRVRAYKNATCNGGWNTGYSNTATVATTTVPPPGGLTATAVGTTQIDLSWTDNTGSETGFKIERCTGQGCSDFTELSKAARNAVAYSDTSACDATTYNYHVKAVNEGLSNGGGGCWTRRAPLMITDFQSDYQTKMIITYDPDMQADFDDIRFYDGTSFSELPYWLESKTDGVSATVWLRTGVNNNIHMYYGNPAAAGASDGSAVFEFFDNFSGTTINTAKWTEIDPDNSISQSDGLILNDVSDSWTKALISNQTIARTSGKMLYARLTIPADTSGNNHFMTGWELNQVSSANYNQLVHGLYWNNYYLTTYEKGSGTGGTGAYSASTAYEMKIELKAPGARYYVKGGAYADWTLVKESSAYNDAVMRVAFVQYSHQANIQFVTVQGYASIEPSVSAGTEEPSSCFTYDVTWETQPGNEASATTPGIAAAPALSTTAGDVFVALAWTDTATDETGFKVERCAGAGCSDFAEITTLAANTTAYSDTGLAIGQTFSYRVRAYKTASCGWNTDYSNTGTETTAVIPPSGFASAAVGTTLINLSWTDTTGSETGFRIERCSGPGCGSFTEISSVGANVTTYQDASVCNSTSYGYRIKAYKTGEWDSGYSDTASAVTATPSAPDLLVTTRISEVQINLSWSDNTTDETGFKVDRCAGAGCTNFIQIASLAAGVTTYNNAGLSPATTYNYRVRAYKTATCSWEEVSSVSSAATTITPPSGLAASAINTTQINLAWTDNTVSETGFRIERCSGADCGDFAEIATAGANAVAYQDSSVCNSTSYSYRVRAYKTSPSWYSDYGSTAAEATATSPAPGSFTATAVTDNQTDLSWTDNTTDETGFRIERCAGAGCGDYAEITTVDSNLTAYSDTTVAPETTYCYRVRAYKTAACGWDTGYGNEYCDVTFAGHPTGLTATTLNSMIIRLDWIDNANNEDGYEIEVQIWNGKFVKIATVGQDVVTYTDTMSIEPEKTYTYRVRTFKGQDRSSYSNEAQVTTPAYQQGDGTCN